MLLAPWTGLGAALRRARLFHPRGIVFAAEIVPLARGEVARRLAGAAIVRFSTAWWKRREWPDVLGVAVRAAEQDLLLATVRRPWLLPLAPLTTRVGDFLDNRYFGVSPFDVDGVGRVHLRLVPRAPAGGDGSRAARLLAAARDGRARLVLETRRRGGAWEPLVEIVLGAPLELPDGALAFSPFRDGGGIHPRGLVHALRPATYRASQRIRAIPQG